MTSIIVCPGCDKRRATSSNILTVYVETGTNRSIAVTHQEDEDEPGFTVSANGPGLQLFIPREAIDPDRGTSIN